MDMGREYTDVGFEPYIQSDGTIRVDRVETVGRVSGRGRERGEITTTSFVVQDKTELAKLIQELVGTLAWYDQTIEEHKAFKARMEAREARAE